MKIRENLYARAQVFANEYATKALDLSWLIQVPFNYVKILGEERKLELGWSGYEGLLSGTYTFIEEEKERNIHVYLPYEELGYWVADHVGSEVDAELIKYSVHPMHLKEYCDVLQKHFTDIYINLPIGYMVDTVFKIHIHPWAEYSENCTHESDVLFVEVTAPHFSYEPIYRHAPELFEKDLGERR